jgi:FAD:protein FMN transferase
MIHGFRLTALGSTGRIRIANVDEALAQRAVVEVVRWLRDVEARLSRFRADSLVGRLNAGEAVTADGDLLAVLAAADQAHQVTGGRYDATAFPLWRLWHDPARTTWPTQEEIADAQALIAWSAVERAAHVHLTRPGMALDLGGVGKEWCVDQVLARLIAHGCADVLVELGGDCAARGSQPGRDGWFVLLPGIAAALALRDEAIATSGIGTRRRLLAARAVSHLIDVRTGHPAPGIIRSATVLAADCLTAGIHASDLCLLHEATSEAIAQRSHGHATWVRASDGTVLADPRLVARVHPVASDKGSTVHPAPCTPHLARSA